MVKAAHREVKPTNEAVVGRCDSFVVETNVHYPTDLNLLLDAIRKLITLSARLAETNQQQHSYYQRKFKRLYRQISRLRHSTSRDPLRQTARDNAVAEACGAYLRAAIEHVERARATCASVDASVAANQRLIREISGFAEHAMRQIDQIHRRLLLGETIPHDEKVFSIFEPHTEWVSKGKAGVPVELGVRVCVMSDQHGFILHHRVMERCTDGSVPVPMVRDARERYPELRAVSMDKGFHSPWTPE